MTSGKTVIVTGASQGIGAGIVQRFADRGFNIVRQRRSRRSFASSLRNEAPEATGRDKPAITPCFIVFRVAREKLSATQEQRNHWRSSPI
jgi:NAD(P)-dependent dehydrogenase (short-subunit alcohol dehydrogenase family)